MSNLINIHDFFSLQVKRNEQYTSELISLNDQTAEYGLVLSSADASDLIDTRAKALRENGRIETGLGALSMIIKVFSVSEYINQQNYAQTMHELLELFYYLKTESRDRISDRELIELLFDKFENECHGSLDLMTADEITLPGLDGIGKKSQRRDTTEDDETNDQNSSSWDEEDSSDDDDYYLWDSKNGK